jgi:hypothetical protein
VVEQGREGKVGWEMFFASDAGADYFRAGEENVREFYRNWSLATSPTSTSAAPADAATRRRVSS